ncbi:ATP-binding protein [Microcoleus sp. B3-A4]|uniref:ATP-binding protein n=1 Tax=Microcoleus sp. B3-A4 TaxID=2818653 RepID=UPI002FCFA2CF
MIKQPSNFLKIVAGSLGATTFLALAVSGIAFWSANRTLETNRQIAQHLKALNCLEALTSAFQDAEKMQRQYLLAPNKNDFRKFGLRTIDVDQELRQLQSLLENDPRQQAATKRLEEFILGRLGELRQGVELRDTKGLAAAIDRTPPRLLDEMTLLTQQIKAIETVGWRQKQQAATHTTLLAMMAFLVGIALNLGIILWTYRLICSEILKRNQAETDLQQSNQTFQNQTSLLQLILNSMSDAVLVADENGRLLLFNPAAEQMFGKITDSQPEEWSEQYGLFHADGATPILAEQIPLVRAVRGEQVDNMELLSRHSKAQQGVWMTVSSRPLKDASGALKGGVVVCHDTSDRKSTELQILRAKEAAEVANRTKSEFLANMNHELRTPLNGILGYTQILQRDPATTAKQMKGLGVIYQCGSHLLTLINDILDLSKLEVQKMELYPQDFHLANFLSSTVDICRVKAVQKGVEFHYQPASNLPTAVHADDKRLRQVLLNLLSNAVKFTDFGTVTFRVEVVESEDSNSELKTQNSKISRIRFLIKDTGIGIAPDKLSTIFLPFEQAGKRDRNIEGTGLGLAIGQQIIEKMDSEIHVESVLGQGSSFWFEIDLLPASDWTTQNAIANHKVIGYQGERRKILVIDDREENRLVAVNMLEPLGFKLTEADNGQAGLDTTIQTRPDLIITDVHMAIMDGLEMTRRLRQLPDFAQTPIIASPATLSQVDIQESLDAGCNSFFPKPIEFTGLLAELQRYLELQWIYETETEATQPAVSNADEVSMIIPPAAELATLYAAAQGGFMTDIQQEAHRLKQLTPEYIAFANRVLELSQQFDEEAILRLIEPQV